MRRFAALLVPLCLAAVGCPGTEQDFSVPTQDAEPGPPDAATDIEAGPPQPLKVMTWNVKNLYNDKKDSPEVAVADETILSTSDYQAKLAAIATVVGGVKPDVLMLQEVENQNVVSDLAAKLGGFPHQAITQGNDPRGIDIAVLSALPFQIGPSHKDEYFKASSDPTQTFKFARDVLEVHLNVNGRHLALLGIHFKAEDGDPKSALKRVAEAEQTRKIDRRPARRSQRRHRGSGRLQLHPGLRSHECAGGDRAVLAVERDGGAARCGSLQRDLRRKRRVVRRSALRPGGHQPARRGLGPDRPRRRGEHRQRPRPRGGHLRPQVDGGGSVFRET